MDEPTQQPVPGTIFHHDLTVPDAEGVRDFYAAVAGWTAEGLSMGDYDDFVMRDSAGTPVAGVCHARGGNAGLPAQWLMYVRVADLDSSIAAATAAGGRALTDAKGEGSDRYCVLEDPAGAVFAICGP
jgi:predicted enzyme related to lactoylglutathione lyase